MATLEEVAEAAAVATHALRINLEAFAVQLHEMEVGFRRLKDLAEDDARQRLARATSRLARLLEPTERALADARTKFQGIADGLQ